MKTVNKDLIRCADNALQGSKILKDGKINETYKGYTAALGVSIVMIGLCPTLAIYYQDADKEDADKGKKKKLAYRSEVLNIIAKMIEPKKTSIKNAEDLFRYAIKNAEDDILQKEIINCSIALKHVVRTYELIKEGD
jgi:CRISPR/Cas system CMR-associated protein Cmr5 small subunit